MSSALSFVQNELTSLFEQKKRLLATLPEEHLPTDLASLIVDYTDERVGDYPDETEAFWQEKCKGYFPKRNKPPQMAHEAFFKQMLNRLLTNLSRDGFALENAGNEAKNNPAIVMSAVKQRGWALKFAGDKTKDDRDIVMVAVAQDWSALQVAGNEARNDPEIVMAAIKKSPDALKYAGDEAKNNPRIVMDAVSQDWLVLQFAGDKAKDDPEIVMLAVKQDLYALKFASKRLQEEFKKEKCFLSKQENQKKSRDLHSFKEKMVSAREEKKDDNEPKDKGSCSIM